MEPYYKKEKFHFNESVSPIGSPKISTKKIKILGNEPSNSLSGLKSELLLSPKFKAENTNDITVPLERKIEKFENDRNFDFVDSFEVNCAVHNQIVIGVCGEPNCKVSDLMCLQCINEKKFVCTEIINKPEEDIEIESPDNSRISNNETLNHQITSIGNLLNNFFCTQEESNIDFNRLSSLISLVKDINKNDVLSKVSSNLKSMESLYQDLVNKIKKSMEDEINKMHNEYLEELEKLELGLSQVFEEENILDVEFPEIFLNDKNMQKLKEKFLNSDFISKCKSGQSSLNLNKETTDFKNFVELFSDKEKVSKGISYIEKILYFNKITEKDDLEILFQSKIDDIIQKTENILDELDKVFFPEIKDTIGMVANSPNSEFKENPNNLTFSHNICENAHKSNSIDCVFTCFKSVKNEYIVLWGTPTFYIEAYDMTLAKVVISKNAHTSTIFSCRHYIDNTKTDIILTSSYDKSVKLWNFNAGLKNILNITNAHTGLYIYSACLLVNSLKDDKNYVITSAPSELMKKWDMKGALVGEFGVNTTSTYFVSTYSDTKKKQDYVINCNSVDVKSYDSSLTLYKTYKAINNSTWHMSASIIEKKDVTILVESDGTGNIKYWDFHLAVVLKQVASPGVNLRGLCVWNENYIISSGSDHAIKIYNMKNLVMSSSFINHTSTVCSVMKINVPKYGECLISHALDGKLKLWTIGKK